MQRGFDTFAPPHVYLTTGAARTTQTMLKRTFLLASLMFICFVASLIIHEAGHAVAGKLFGLGNPIINVWPGIELLPSIGKTVSSDLWPANAVAYVTFIPETPTFAVEFPASTQSLRLDAKLKLIDTHTYHDNIFLPIVGLMGSGTTYIMSLFCTLYMYLLKPKGVLRAVIATGTFLFYDILCYTVFPVFFGMSHLIFIGGAQPEPIISLVNMGMSFNTAVTLILGVCGAQILAIYYVARKRGLFFAKST